MDSYTNEQTDRRRFLKGAAGVGVCCACLSLDCSQENASERRIEHGKGKVHLAAACGTYCGACPAYLAKHGEDEHIRTNLQERSSSEPAKAQKGIPPANWMDGLLCDGCLSGGTLAAHCQRCDIRLHALSKQEDSRCTHCGELPCYRITHLVNMGGYLHRKEYLPNLGKIRRVGVRDWVQHEEERWRCPRCGLPMSWYDAECARCGEPRSKDLFPLE
ncbi:MAG: DUF3795 domain-containing protein [Phycisphaerae bacterium]|nr:DUF3795 domain-containing protein [Phycisphaerae bacterium]